MLDLRDILNTTINGDVINVLPTLPDKCVHSIITSPPYFAVRDYKLTPTDWPEVTFSLFGFPITIPAMSCQLGLEKTPFEFVGHLVHVFRLAHRVLRDDGTLWVNMGDCYNSKSGGYNNSPEHRGRHYYISKHTAGAIQKINRKIPGLKQKDMIGIPWLMAFALRDDGWYLRQEIIWHKPNPMPESVNDRCTKAHEQIFLLSKNKKYYFDAYSISTEIQDETVKRYLRSKDNHVLPSGWGNSPNFKDRDPRDNRRGGVADSDQTEKLWGRNDPRDDRQIKGYDHKLDKNTNIAGHSGYFNKDGELIGNGKANKKSVWTIATKSFSEAHFATFPEELPVDPIKASTSKHGVCAECGAPWKLKTDKKLVPGNKAAKTFVIDERDNNADSQDQGSNRQKDGHKSGYHYQHTNERWLSSCKCNAEVVPAVVMDLFSGAGTTRLISRKLQRNFIGIDKNAGYNQIEETRINDALGMFR